MIQRIQTIFFLVAFILIGLLFFMPFTNLISTEVYSFSLKGISPSDSIGTLQQPYWLTMLGAVTIILIGTTIFLYKNRKLQMKLTIVSIILALVLNGLMYFLTNQYHSILNAEINYNAVFVFPVISAILLFLAYRSIKKDEDLIKSLNRIR